jgi:hypothetical protein
MKNFTKYKKDIFLYFFFISTLIVFENLYVEVLNKFIVKPLFSTIKISNNQIDVTVILICIYILYEYINRANKNIAFPKLITKINIYASLIYLYFRFFKTVHFEYTAFSISVFKSIYLADIIIINLAGMIIYYKIKSKNILANYDNTTESEKNGFFIDVPVILKEKNDDIKKLITLLLNTNVSTNSFSVGIVGKWGSGKTTFMETLKENLNNNENVIQLNYNPWDYQNATGITTSFFDILGKDLSKYDQSIDYKLRLYCKEHNTCGAENAGAL